MNVSPRRWLWGRAKWLERRARRPHEPHGIVLMYHRVAREHVDPWDLCVWPDRFEVQIRVLRECTDMVAVGEIFDHLRSGRASRPVVAVTFDDGYVDNLLVAKPILERYETPATVYLATGYLGGSAAYWWDTLALAILTAERLPVQLSLQCEAARFEWPDRSQTRGRRTRRALHDRLWHWILDRPAAYRSTLVEQICAWAHGSAAPLTDARPMTPEEVAELTSGGLVDIGGHTRTHPMLSKLPSDQKKEEIIGGRRDCRDIVGRDPVSFAFPHGDFDQESIECVHRAGFALACTSQPGLVWSTTSPLTTPRIAVGNWDERTFRRKLRWWLA